MSSSFGLPSRPSRVKTAPVSFQPSMKGDRATLREEGLLLNTIAGYQVKARRGPAVPPQGGSDINAYKTYKAYNNDNYADVINHGLGLGLGSSITPTTTTSAKTSREKQRQTTTTTTTSSSSSNKTKSKNKPTPKHNIKTAPSAPVKGWSAADLNLLQSLIAQHGEDWKAIHKRMQHKR